MAGGVGSGIKPVDGVALLRECCLKWVATDSSAFRRSSSVTLCVRSFVHSFVRSFVRSFACLVACLSTTARVPSTPLPLLLTVDRRRFRSLISFICSFVRSFVHVTLDEPTRHRCCGCGYTHVNLTPAFPFDVPSPPLFV